MGAEPPKSFISPRACISSRQDLGVEQFEASIPRKRRSAGLPSVKSEEVFGIHSLTRTPTVGSFSGEIPLLDRLTRVATRVTRV